MKVKSEIEDGKLHMVCEECNRIAMSDIIVSDNGQPFLTVSCRFCGDEQQIRRLERAPRQQLLYQAIASAADGLNENQLNEKFDRWRPVVLQLEKKGLLQKIEELTLYIIEQEKRVEALESINN